jgi:hypothetical protein
MGFTALHGLAAKGMTQEIQKLVDNEWVPVRNSPSVQYAGRHKNSTLATAAFLACDRCDRAILTEAVRSQIPWEVDEWGNNALHYAAEGGHEDTIGLLLEINFDAQMQDRSGHTALMLAAREARVDVVHMLIQRSVDVNACNSERRTALHQVCASEMLMRRNLPSHTSLVPRIFFSTHEHVLRY